MMSLLGRTAKTVRFLASDPVGEAKLGLTPHTIVHRQGKAAVRHFAPEVAKHSPVFISMPLINTWTVWDLLPGRSTVAGLVAAGVPVYLLDWGRPGPEDADNRLSYYIDDLMGRAFDRVARHAKATYEAETIDAIGYCVGGTFLSVFLARNDGIARKASFVCTPIDFHASGRLSLWANPDFPADAIPRNLGNYPADMMRTSFKWLKPSGATRKYVSLWERIERDDFRELWAALEHWNADNVDFPGTAYAEYVNRCYIDNALVNGGWLLDGRPVDLGKATVPALVISASGDHIAPPAACDGLAKRWGGEVTQQCIRGGHVGISVSAKLPAALVEWTAA